MDYIHLATLTNFNEDTAMKYYKLKFCQNNNKRKNKRQLKKHFVVNTKIWYNNIFALYINVIV